MSYTPPVSLLRLPDVLRIAGISKTTLYGLVKVGEFPAPVPLGGRAVAWASTEVEAWVANKLRAAGKEIAA